MSADRIDFEKFRLKDRPIPTVQPGPQARTARRDKRRVTPDAERFVYRLPLPWIRAAGGTRSTDAILVALAIQYQAGLHSPRRGYGDEIILSSQRCDELGIKRWQSVRGIRWLEEAGLIKVRRSNKAPRITILPPPVGG
jgi:hypothetical protein